MPPLHDKASTDDRAMRGGKMPAWGLISVEHTTNLQPCDVLIRNGYVVTLDAARRIIDPGAVAIRGNSIVAVGPEAEVLALHRADRVLDADGGIVHPGLIDAHNHIVHGTARGIFGGTSGASTTISFADWKADVTPDDEFIATALAALEMLRAGFTTFVEPGTAFDTDAIAAAATAVGVRALLAAPYLWDQIEVMRYLGGLESQSLYRRAPPTRDRSLAELGRELHRNRDEAGQVHGYVSVYGLGTASDELLIAGKAMADWPVSFSNSTKAIPRPLHVLTGRELGDPGFATYMRSDCSAPIPASSMSMCWRMATSM